MEFYSGKQPNLIGPIMKRTLGKVLNKKIIQKNSISDKISQLMSDIYKTYLQENKIIVFIILLIIVFLVYRYYNIKNKKKIVPKKNKDHFNNEKILSKILKNFDNNDSEEFFDDYLKDDNFKESSPPLDIFNDDVPNYLKNHIPQHSNSFNSFDNNKEDDTDYQSILNNMQTHLNSEEYILQPPYATEM